MQQVHAHAHQSSIGYVYLCLWQCFLYSVWVQFALVCLHAHKYVHVHKHVRLLGCLQEHLSLQKQLLHSDSGKAERLAIS